MIDAERSVRPRSARSAAIDASQHTRPSFTTPAVPIARRHPPKPAMANLLTAIERLGHRRRAPRGI